MNYLKRKSLKMVSYIKQPINCAGISAYSVEVIYCYSKPAQKIRVTGIIFKNEILLHDGLNCIVVIWLYIDTGVVLFGIIDQVFSQIEGK